MTYASKQVVRISTKDLKIDDIMSRINGVAEDMDMQEVHATWGNWDVCQVCFLTPLPLVS